MASGSRWDDAPRSGPSRGAGPIRCQTEGDLGGPAARPLRSLIRRSIVETDADAEAIVELLERAEQLDQLDRLLNDAGRGGGRLVFLEGEAGIGKTAVLRAEVTSPLNVAAAEWLAARAGTSLFECPGPHLAYLTDPRAVAAAVGPFLARAAS